jgi:hypothetical protein
MNIQDFLSPNVVTIDFAPSQHAEATFTVGESKRSSRDVQAITPVSHDR